MGCGSSQSVKPRNTKRQLSAPVSLIISSSKPKCKSVVNAQFMVSYGSWIGIVQFLDQFNVLQLQGMCRYMYCTGMTRLMSSWTLVKNNAFFHVNDIIFDEHGRAHVDLRKGPDRKGRYSYDDESMSKLKTHLRS